MAASPHVAHPSWYSPCRRLNVTPTFASSAWTAIQSGPGYTSPACSRSGNRRAYTSPALIHSASSQTTSRSAAALSTSETLAFNACSTEAIALSDTPPICSRRHTGSRKKGTDHGKKDTGEGGAKAEVVEPVGGARARARAVLKRAAGGTEGRYSRFRMAVLKRATVVRRKTITQQICSVASLDPSFTSR